MGKVVSAENEILDAMQAFPAMPASHRDSSAVAREQQRERAEFVKSMKEVEKLRGKARKIFEYGVGYISPEALVRWVTDLDMRSEKVGRQSVRFGELFWTMSSDGMVLVKCVSDIRGITKEDIIKRSKALAHYMRHCEGIMQVQAIQFPDMIVYGSKNAIPLDVYLRQNELSSGDKWVLALKIASALGYVHECEIIHRNIRAASVFM
ncbi:hypothetical protein DFQ27_000709, partial [Actinomortierella ambigua]